MCRREVASNVSEMWALDVGCYAGADGQSLCSDDWLIRAQGRAVVRG